MSTVLTRGITGIVLISIITTAILASLYSFIGLLFIINLLGLIEFYKLIAKEPIHPNLKEGIFLSVVLFLSSSLMLCRYFDWPVLLINVVSVAIIFFLELYRSSSNPFQNLALTFFGIIYITLPIILFEGISLLPFHEGAYHPKIILGYFILLWMSDSAAYAVGNLAGRHKLFERISPKKNMGRKYWRRPLCFWFSLSYFHICERSELARLDDYVPDHCGDGHLRRSI